MYCITRQALFSKHLCLPRNGAPPLCIPRLLPLSLVQDVTWLSCGSYICMRLPYAQNQFFFCYSVVYQFNYQTSQRTQEKSREKISAPMVDVSQEKHIALKIFKFICHWVSQENATKIIAQQTETVLETKFDFHKITRENTGLCRKLYLGLMNLLKAK